MSAMDTLGDTDSTKGGVCTMCTVVQTMHRSTCARLEDKQGERGSRPLAHAEVVVIPLSRWQAKDNDTLQYRAS